MHNFKIILSAIMSALFFNSCNTLSNKEAEDLKNKNFYLQQFIYFEKGINNEIAFNAMKDFPTDKVIKILGHKYNINIDTSEYEDFLAPEDASKIKSPGLIFSDYTWVNKDKNAYTVELEYRKDLVSRLNNVGIKLTCIIKLKANDKTIYKSYINIYENVPPLVTIAEFLGYSRVDKNNDKYINNETKAVVDLTAESKKKPVEAKAE